MLKTFFAFVSGIIFSIGLTLSGMTNPENIIGFLDITGQWNPGLILVLCSAVVVTAIGYRLVWKRPAPLLDTEFFVPANRVIDRRLISGAAIFGVGWGLAGLCPGPALSSLTTGHTGIWAFTVTMLIGMLIRHNTDILTSNHAKHMA